jgi:hypothetical protein
LYRKDTSAVDFASLIGDYGMSVECVSPSIMIINRLYTEVYVNLCTIIESGVISRRHLPSAVYG